MYSRRSGPLNVRIRETDHSLGVEGQKDTEVCAIRPGETLRKTTLNKHPLPPSIQIADHHGHGLNVMQHPD